ncbi:MULTISPECIES: class I adenylate-forming enzyme family protein [unclassified Beijerinckia]|uniref:class I adenylate-forming enzyme family protein n=1 Tax=unclassified Beijerinckia TaxID=2638183 RepID=UPI00089598FB|nr:MULTISPECIES: class I adenylate-forming enzyme family protein [unclassified Beijerinckia]MDH7796301.1 acyl-CoA synthetase (AMP-forming)/AMP-acid ligase II [Beijerinckia sp. GAS462]SEC39075.1 Acyl-CoA synthetase (AMP-forming)/AMP-acid ligase II [Beijerinckia sp. 28-YEA-48]
MILVSQERAREFKAKGWWDERRLFDLFDEHVRVRPNAEACIDPPNVASITGETPQRLTWATLDDQVTRLMAVLLDSGIVRDDVVLVQLPNTVELFVVYLACMKLGIVATPVAIQYREHELTHVAQITDAKLVITAARIGKHPHGEMFARLAPKLPKMQTIFTYGGATEGTRDLRALLASVDVGARQRALAAAKTAAVSADDIVTICWTSGTEAAPKGVPRSHNEWFVVGEMVIAAAFLRSGARLLNPFPMINMAGISTGFSAWLVLGATMVQHQPFDLDVFLQQIRDEKIEYTVAPPAILNRLLHNEQLLTGIDFNILSRLGSGSAPLSEWMVRTWHERYGVEVINYFGSNEGASFAGTLADIPDPAERAVFFPRFAPQFKWDFAYADRVATRLVDPVTEEEITEIGGLGELRVKGAPIFSGYWRSAEQNARAFDAEGWYRTGDLFELAGDRGQFFRFMGRLKDIIIRGGMNISAEELEGHLAGHPKVAEVAIVGIPDQILGERICACVAPRAGETLTLEDVNRFLLNDKQVAIYKQIERLELFPALPRNPVGKLLKRELRAKLASETAS